MGKMQSAVWFIGVTIYFILFIAIVSSVSSFARETNNSFADGTTTNGSIDSLTLESEPYCDAPRYSYASDGTATYTINAKEDNCVFTSGKFSQSSCESLVGCSWENVTTGFLWFSETTETCTGTLNATYYQITDENNFCTSPIVSNNATLCIRMGCLMYVNEPLTYDITSPKQLLVLVSDLFSFRYDFGFTGLLNVVLTIFFIFLPLFIWLLALYFMLPFVH